MTVVSSTTPALPSCPSRLSTISSVTVGGVWLIASAYAMTSRSSGVKTSDSRPRDVEAVVLGHEVVEVEAPRAADERRHGHVREGLEALVARVPLLQLLP